MRDRRDSVVLDCSDGVERGGVVWGKCHAGVCYLAADICYLTGHSVSVGIHALINVHEYHCIAIRVRCWLMDVLIILVEVA